jgi:hypothetical protein
MKVKRLADRLVVVPEAEPFDRIQKCGRRGVSLRPEPDHAAHELAGRAAERPAAFAAPAARGLRLLLVAVRDGLYRRAEQSLDRAGYRPVLAAPPRVPDGAAAIVRARALDRSRRARGRVRSRRG